MSLMGRSYLDIYLTRLFFTLVVGLVLSLVWCCEVLMWMGIWWGDQ